MLRLVDSKDTFVEAVENRTALDGTVSKNTSETWILACRKGGYYLLF